VLKWTSIRANELTNCYSKDDPDVILLNSTGNLINKKIHIFNYNINYKNSYSEDYAGIAIAVKKNIKYKLLEISEEDMLAIEINTVKGPIIIATMYQPPRRPYLPIDEMARLFRNSCPVYFMGDLNANHKQLGNNNNNNNGKAVYSLLRNNLVTHIGPDFPTFFGNSTGKPDIVLGNKNIHFNYTLTQGQITTSDHLPMILILDTRPIKAKITRTFNYKKANWNLFKEKLLELNTLNNNHTIIINKETIDERVSNWINNINKAAEVAIPKTNQKN